jgi:hypothetical protein
MTTDRTYSIRQTGQILGIGPGQVWRYITSGRLPASRGAKRSGLGRGGV